MRDVLRKSLPIWCATGAICAKRTESRCLTGWVGALFGDSTPDRFVDRLRDPRRVQPVLLQDVRSLALRQELIRQGDGADPYSQAVRRERLEPRASESAGADVVLDGDDDRVRACPIGDSRIDRLDPSRVDHGA